MLGNGLTGTSSPSDLFQTEIHGPAKVGGQRSPERDVDMKRIAGIRTRGFLAALALSLVLGAGLDLSAQIRPDVEQLLNEGLSLLRQDQLDAAQQKFEKALMLDVTSEEALAWIEKVGYQQLLASLRGDNGTLEGQLKTLMELSSTEVRRRESDPSRIDAALSAYFSSGDRLEKTKALIEAVNTHGVYLLPGLVARTAEADAPVRVAAILAIVKLADDAVLPLCRVLQSTEVRQVQAAISALQRVGNPAAVPSLLFVAETHPDSLVRVAAREAANKLSSSNQSAVGALLEQANRFYNDSSYLTRSYHDPLIWVIDGENLSHQACEGWELNELRAGQLIGDALAIDPGSQNAHVLAACNLMARFAEFAEVADVVAAQVADGSADESRIAKIRSRELEMELVKSQAYAIAGSVLLDAVDLAVEERRPDVATELIQAVQSFVTPGTRAESIPGALSRALKFDHRGVRFAAAECIAYMNPRGGYSAGDEVIDHLNEGLTTAGRRVALTVFPKEEDHLHAASILERANVSSWNDTTAIGGLERALALPKDLIVLAPGLEDMPTAQLIRRLRSDYRTRNIPIIVMSDDADLAENEATYASEEDGILVINRSIDPLRLRDSLLAGILEGSKAEDEMIAARAAEAIRYLAARETGFDLSSSELALVSALENPNDTVRIPACRALASLGVKRAEGALVRILQEGDATTPELQVAALKALGDVFRGADIQPATRSVLESMGSSSNVQIQRAAHRAKGMIPGSGGDIRRAMQPGN